MTLTLKLGKKFWIVLTLGLMVFTLFIAGRNGLHAVKIRRQISVLEREKERFQQKISRDSMLLEQLKYDDYLEQYAREHYHMQRVGEHVYIIK